MINLVEMCTANQHDSPCRYGNIVNGHACYCHAPVDETPRKCPIWRNYGENNIEKWHNRGDFDSDEWVGGCKWFMPNK